MKTCACCKEEKQNNDFSIDKAAKDGLYSICKQCKSIKDKERYALIKEAKKEQRRKHYEATKEYTRSKQAAYYRNNKPLFRKHAADRRSQQIKATPPWFSKEDVQYYYNLAEYFTWLSGGFVKYHVDHVVPLRGKNVCGLHVQNNLQVINSVANLRKSNKHVSNI